MDSFFLYILYSESINKYYIGISHDPEKRLQYHNSAKKGWTIRGRPWICVFKKEFISKEEAAFWEKKIKAIKRKDIIELIITGKFKWICE
jgi:putative endonuclease